MKNLYLLGKGGHSRSVAEVAVGEMLAKSITILSLEEFESSYQLLSQDDSAFLVGIGDIGLRNTYFEKLLQRNLPITSVVAGTAILSDDLSLGQGCAVMPSAVVRTGSTISSNTIVNTGAIIEHDCFIGKCCNISPGVVVCGTCTIGNYVFIGAGTVISDGVKICDHAVIGAGATVLKNIEVPGTYVGCPAIRVI